MLGLLSLLFIKAFAQRPLTCSPDCPSHALPFCNFSLSINDRVTDLLQRMSLEDKITAFQQPANRFVGIPALNVKSFAWDATCIHGLSTFNGILDPHRVSTVFAHAIAQAATWDLDLISRVSTATQKELRSINVENYAATGGDKWMGTSCDGGALANTVHDPRYGRASETFGEDPYLASEMAISMTRALQNSSSDGRWVAISTVIRHFLGFHYANDLSSGGEESVTSHFFEDQQAIPYRRALVEGGAEGLMCAMSSFSIDGGPQIPSCLHPYLWEKLRVDWGYTGFVQTDW